MYINYLREKLHHDPFPIPVNSGINLPDFEGIFSVSLSLLHMIVLPLRLMGLMMVTVALMKEPLLKVSCPTIDEVLSVPVTVVPTSRPLRKVNDVDEPVLVLISQMRNPISLVHQKTATSLKHSAET